MAVDTTRLLVPIDWVARRLGLGSTLSETEQHRIADAILDVQADVQTYLGVPLLPVTTSKDFGYSYEWEQWLRDLVNVTNVTYEALSNGLVRVVATHGYDARTPEMDPVRRYVQRAVLAHADVMALWSSKAPTEVTRRKKSVSTDGQSITYDYVSPDGQVLSDVAKAGVPMLASLDYWRVAGRRVAQGHGFGSDPLPADGYIGSWRPW